MEMNTSDISSVYGGHVHNNNHLWESSLGWGRLTLRLLATGTSGSLDSSPSSHASTVKLVNSVHRHPNKGRLSVYRSYPRHWPHAHHQSCPLQGIAVVGEGERTRPLSDHSQRCQTDRFLMDHTSCMDSGDTSTLHHQPGNVSSTIFIT